MYSVTAMLIQVKDLDAGMSFYSKVLGVTFEKHASTTCMGSLGSLVIVLQEQDTPGITTQISFAVEDLASAKQTVLLQGGSLKTDVYSGPFGEAVLMNDPNGLPLEFVTLSPKMQALIAEKH